jgi:hypothetical protein
VNFLDLWPTAMLPVIEVFFVIQNSPFNKNKNEKCFELPRLTVLNIIDVLARKVHMKPKNL